MWGAVKKSRQAEPFGEARWSEEEERSRQVEGALSSSQSEKHCQAVWNPEEREGDALSLIGAGIASQPLLPGQAIMCPLCSRDRRRRRSRGFGKGWFYLDLQALAVQMQTSPPLGSSLPISPEERSGADGEGMQQHAHLARFGCCATIPLALLAQGTRTTITNAGPIDHAQTAIGFSAVFMREAHAPSRAPERPTRLERKVGPGKVSSFPGGRGGRWSIPRGERGGRRRGGVLV